MRCKNCGLPKDAHIGTPGMRGRTVWRCPNGSGDTYPAMTDIKLELHYRAGEHAPWVVTWLHPETGAGEVVAAEPALALELAGRRIEHTLEERSPDQEAIERAIKE